jgi:Rrf2 family protein
MFSQTSEYALRAVACLARGDREPMTTRQIALACRVPAGYLSKILQALARAGIVTGQRGLNGGFVLARPPGDLTLLDVVHVADGSRRIITCPLGIPGHGPNLCPLHRRLDDAAALAERTLGDVTIADVLSEPLCSAESARDPACAGDGAGPETSAACADDGARVTASVARAGDGAAPFRPDPGGTPRLAPLCDQHGSCRPARSA